MKVYKDKFTYSDKRGTKKGLTYYSQDGKFIQVVLLNFHFTSTLGSSSKYRYTII